jgi:hypothetical protein
MRSTAASPRVVGGGVFWGAKARGKKKDNEKKRKNVGAAMTATNMPPGFLSSWEVLGRKREWGR